MGLRLTAFFVAMICSAVFDAVVYDGASEACRSREVVLLSRQQRANQAWKVAYTPDGRIRVALHGCQSWSAVSDVISGHTPARQAQERGHLRNSRETCFLVRCKGMVLLSQSLQPLIR